MDDQDVAKHWDENAPEWVRAVRAGWDVYRLYVNNPAFFRLLGDVRGRRVLDLGCGEGTNTRLLADRGAAVVGVDVSPAMVAAARDAEAKEPRGIAYEVVSASGLRRFTDGSFDLVVSTMALMDLPDYAGAVREAHRVLAPGGVFQFSITHPVTTTRRTRWVRNEKGEREGWLIGNCFGLEPAEPGREVDVWYFGSAPPEAKAAARPFRVPRFFRTLSEYFNTLAEARFAVERIEEPVADAAAVAACPAVADTRMAPCFLIFRCRRA